MTAPSWPSGQRAARHARLMAGAAALTDDDRRWLTDTAGARTTCTGRCRLPLNHHGDQRQRAGMTDLAGSWLHCSTAARHGCGCTRCVTWRKALADARTGTQPIPTLFDQER